MGEFRIRPIFLSELDIWSNEQDQADLPRKMAMRNGSGAAPTTLQSKCKEDNALNLEYLIIRIPRLTTCRCHKFSARHPLWNLNVPEYKKGRIW